MRKKWRALLCAALAVLLCACGEKDGPEQEEDAPQASVLSVSLPGAIGSLDPFYSVSQGGETVLLHLYENLMRWEDGGDGWAVAAPGQAESYTVETDLEGNATYTFTLREGLVWSDGTPVTAADFVSAWQTLADPAGDLPHRELLSCIAGYDEILGDDTQDGGEGGEPDGDETADDAEEPDPEETSPLAVSAPDERTFVVTLKGNPAYFLEEVCASAYTVPRPRGAVDGSVTNGPYVVREADAAHAVLTRSERYYAPEDGGPDEICFYTAGEADYEYQQLQEGGRDLITALPESVLRELAEGGLWTPEPVSAAYGVLLNTLQAPFDNANVRLAFHLAIDRQAVVEALGDVTARPAPGIVPYGVSDYSPRPVAEEPVADDSLPDPITGTGPEPEEPAPTCWDYRAHALDVVTAEHAHEYETDFRYAQALLAQAGYPGGNGFPAVEYLYVNEQPSDRITAGLLQKMWKECLGVTVTVREVSREAYDAALAPALPEEEEEDGEAIPAASFQMAAQSLSPVYSDALVLLERWHSESPDNVTGYASDSYDILIRSAQNAVGAGARDAYLHDAEAILLSDSPVIPVLCRGGSYLLREGLEGLYRAPDGVFFLYGVHPESSEG